MSGGAQTLANPIDAAVSKGFQSAGAPKTTADLAAGGPYFAQAGTIAGGGSSGSGLPNALPNLGPQSLLPIMAGGAFQRPDLNGGIFNAMSAQGAGRLFNPAAGRTSIPQAAFSPMNATSPKGNALSPDMKHRIINRGVLQ